MFYNGLPDVLHIGEFHLFCKMEMLEGILMGSWEQRCGMHLRSGRSVI